MKQLLVGLISMLLIIGMVTVPKVQAAENSVMNSVINKLARDGEEIKDVMGPGIKIQFLKYIEKPEANVEIKVYYVLYSVVDLEGKYIPVRFDINVEIWKSVEDGKKYEINQMIMAFDTEGTLQEIRCTYLVETTEGEVLEVTPQEPPSKDEIIEIANILLGYLMRKIEIS